MPKQSVASLGWALTAKRVTIPKEEKEKETRKPISRVPEMETQLVRQGDDVGFRKYLHK
jgi:hypothetical protein